MTTLKYKITNYLSDVHKYNGTQFIGDSLELIEQIKKKDDPYFDYFYNDDKEEFKNNVDNILKNNTRDYPYKVFSLNHTGGGWTEIFACLDKNELCKAFFIDTLSTEFSNFYGDNFASKEHIKLINQMIEKSLKNYNDNSTDSKKWPACLKFDSGNLLFMQSDSEIIFYPENENVKIDYSKSKEEILKSLLEICYNPPCKFKNFNAVKGHVVQSYSNDFHIAQLAWRGGEWNLYKIEALEKDVDWLACYHNEFYGEGENLYRQKKVSTELAIKMKNWEDQSIIGDIFKRSLGEVKDSLSKPEIENYKSHVESFGYTVGYYLVHNTHVD